MCTREWEGLTECAPKSGWGSQGVNPRWVGRTGREPKVKVGLQRMCIVHIGVGGAHKGI